MRPRVLLLALAIPLLSAPSPARADFRAAGPLAVPRTGHMAVLLDESHVLFLGGASPDDRSAEIYDTRSGVSRLVAATMLANHDGGTTSRLPDGRVLIAGGGHVRTQDPFAPVDAYGSTACEIFDPATEQFTMTGALHEPRTRQTATNLPDGRVLVAGGETHLLAPRHCDWSITASCELFDPATGTWSAAPPLMTPRSRHAAVLLRDGRVLFAGGNRTEPNAEIDDPLAGRSAVAASRAGEGASAALLPDGRAIVGGGPAYELVDPASAAVTTLPGAPPVPAQIAVSLEDGSVLFLGGEGPSARFDPARGAIVVGAWPLTPRTGETATLLPDGSVLIAGGGPADRPLASVERFFLAPATARLRAVRK